MIQFLSGKKTYFLALAALAYAIGGFFTGHIDGNSAVDMIWAALAAGALRHGVSTDAQQQ